MSIELQEDPKPTPESVARALGKPEINQFNQREFVNGMEGPIRDELDEFLSKLKEFSEANPEIISGNAGAKIRSAMAGLSVGISDAKDKLNAALEIIRNEESEK